VGTFFPDRALVTHLIDYRVSIVHSKGNIITVYNKDDTYSWVDTTVPKTMYEPDVWNLRRV